LGESGHVLGAKHPQAVLRDRNIAEGDHSAFRHGLLLTLRRAQDESDGGANGGRFCPYIDV
jgi:hypothetical protein